MKITVVGTINKDLILPFHGAPIESFGGIFYDISILSQLFGESDEIMPVSFIGDDMQTPIMAVFENMSNVSTEGLIPIDQKNHKVILEYESPEKRQEKALFNFPHLTWKHVKPFLDSDIIIVNMITGWDIDQKAFLRLAKRVRKKIHLDIHFLVMGVDKLGRRFPQRPDKIKPWLTNSRFLQMNHKEYEIMAGEMEKTEFFKRNLKLDQILMVTNGKMGVEVIYVNFGKITRKHFPAFRLPSVVDTTGCGDAFGAGFVFNFLKTDKLDESVRFANLVAAANALLKGTNEMPLLKDTMDKITSGRVN